MTSNMPIIRALSAAKSFDAELTNYGNTAMTRTFYCIRYNNYSRLEVWDNQDTRNAYYDNYAGVFNSDCACVTFDTVTEVEEFASERGFRTEYHMETPLTDEEKGIYAEPDNHPSSYTTGFTNEFEQHIINVAHTVERLDSEQWELYVLEVLTHAEYQMGTTMDTLYANYRSNPNTHSYALMQGIMAVHQYEYYA